MSTEGQPNTILTVYSPFAWIEELTATNTGSFINYPTAQNGAITFPNTITANKVESSFITTVDNAPLSIGTFVGRTRPIDIGTGMTTGNINLGTASVIVNAVNMNTGFLSCNTNTALEIGNIIGRTTNIKIAENMASGEVIIGSTSSVTKITNIASDNTMDIQNSDRVAEGRISISCGDERLGDINIGVNTHNGAGRTTGNVNIMNGAGRQEGSFNVLTNSFNRGLINLGHIGSSFGGINIFCDFLVAPRIGYASATYTNEDRYLGSSKSITPYSNTGFTAAAATLYVFGNISTALATGTYQVNLKVSLASNNVLDPYLKVGLYTKTGATAWVNGAVLTGGTLQDTTYWVGKAHAPVLSDLFTIQVSGIVTFTAKQQVCIGLGYNTGTGQLSGGSLLSLVRIG